MADIAVLNGKTIVESSGAVYIRTADGKKVTHEASEGSSYTFAYEFSPEDKLMKLTSRKKDAGYELVNHHAKLANTITTAVWRQLPKELRSLYSAKTSFEEVEEEVEVESFINLHTYAEEHPSIIIFSPDDVARAMESLNFTGLNKRAQVKLRYSGALEVTIFEAPYNGETKFVLEKKANGQPYADRRGSEMRDLPKTLSRFTIDIKLIPQLTATSKEVMDKKLKDYYNHITLTSRLKEINEA